MHYSHETQQLENRPLRPSAEPSDEELMTRIQARDDHAIAVLYRRHTALLRTVVGRILHNESDVDDQLQDVFLEVWRQAAHYDVEKGKALGWIVTLARRRAIDRVRRKQAYSRAEERLRESTLTTAESMHPGTDSEAMNGDTAEIFQRILATLPPPQREAVQLAYYTGLSQRDIARRTGIPLGTIKTRLELAVRKMRAAILALGGEAEWHCAHS